MKTKIILTLILISFSAFAGFEVIIPNPTGKGKPFLTLTNVISWEKHTPDCWIIRYIENGQTNEFHSWLITPIIITNK